MQGGCFCGFVRYESLGTRSHQTNCHCSICRRVSAAPFVTWFSAPRAEFRITSGVPAEFASTAHGKRRFCPRCGTPLTFESDQAPAEIDITTCSLDDPEAEPPRDHTRTHSQMSWIAHDGLPRFPEARSDAPAATGTHYDVAVVRVFVHDWPRAVAFYADTLGMRIVTRKDEYKWAEFDVGGCTLAIEELARDDPEAAELVGRYVGISIRVPDIDATYRELTARGVDFRSAPRRQPWGGVLAHLADPEGNVLTLLGEWAGS